jgi:hypothetical protein
LATTDLLSHYEEYKFENNQAKLIKQRSDAIYLRGQALLLANRLKLARKDYERLTELKDSRANAILADVNVCLNRRRRLNKQLVRDAAAWLDVAMCQQGDSRAESNDCHDLDLPSAEENNEDTLIEECHQNVPGHFVSDSVPKFAYTPIEQPVEDINNKEAIILKTESSSMSTPMLSSLLITVLAMTVAAFFAF